jgi:hypothetical protein
VRKLFKLFGYGDREYRCVDFSVRIEPIFREVVSVAYARHNKTANLGGERIGKRWQGIAISIPPEIPPDEVPQMVRDLELAFAAMGYGCVP